MEMQNVDDAAFDQLRLKNGRGDPKYGLVGKKHRPFRHGVHIAGKTQGGEVVDESIEEATAIRQPIQFFDGEVEALEKKVGQ